MESDKRIRVVVVDDSLMFRTAIARGLSVDEQIEVVATARDPHDARDKIIQTNPDVLTLDVEMPGMSGLEFLRILMPQHPMPVVMVSAADGVVFDAMRAGAVDFVAKPEAGQMDAFLRELALKVRIAAIAKTNRAVARSTENGIRMPDVPFAAQANVRKWNPRTIVALGASTGGTEATSTILKALPAHFPPVVIVQHMPPVFTGMYAERLNRESNLAVTEAADGEPILPGHVYIAPGGSQMVVEKQGAAYCIKYRGEEKVGGHCPSVDVLFNSVAEAAGVNAIGILLTGMGADGAEGLLHMRKAGAYTIGQDQQSCVVYGMPMEAMKRGAVVQQAPLEVIPGALINRLRMEKRY